MLDLYSNHKNFSEICSNLNKSYSTKLFIKGLSGSSQSLFISSVFKKINKNLICVLPEKEEAAHFYSDLLSVLGEQKVLFFPSTYRRKYNSNNVSVANSIIRTGVLEKLSQSKSSLLIVTHPEALTEKVVSQQELADNTLVLHKNEKVSISFIEEVLLSYNFERNDFVFQPGQYALRGGIIDVFSFSQEYPYRIDFIGDEVNKIRGFDVESQVSFKEVESIAIIPDLHSKNRNVIESSFFDFINEKPNLFIKDIAIYESVINQFFSESEESGNFFSYNDLYEAFIKYNVIETGLNKFFNNSAVYEFYTLPQPAFNKNFDLLGDDLIDKNSNGYKVYILSENQQQIERINAIFSDMGMSDLFKTINSDIHEGFIDNDLLICYYTEHQIFDKYHKYKLRDDFLKNESLTLNEFYNLHPGDYIVHIDHGIGIFGGLEKVNIKGKWQEHIRLVYKDKDILYVNLNSLHKISKYKAKGGEPPKLYKLGTGAWNRLKQQTKSKIKDIARDLIELYAKRVQEKGFAFLPDSYMQKELEASFLYEDTPDQEKATLATKKDMESLVPMDRLICGDVGFGKTEVAIRAAFKAVADSKQVAILVPTTILALQHFYTFTERLKNFPCNVEFINRFKTAKEQKEIINKINNGNIDIIIGTHKLLNKEIKFKDLGLLIIDEEQKFGVAAKEKLRSIRINVDTLTLTATPIPRTLQFSLMGARDLSIINTPPPNRQPIVTEVYTFNENIIRDAINFEVSRNGQVFFVNNHIQNITEIEKLIRKLCPDVKTVVCHGQMKPSELEDLIIKFINGNFDVLISTTIIENGLDIPNANTIIINNGHTFGLSDLHQLRGRVGRSNRKAFCYIMAPPVSVLPQDARRRLKAIEEFSELGSGFNIALQDLDIRGAGNMLGAEQSGFIADIGFETYQKILQEAMLELRESEYANLPERAKDKQDESQKQYVSDCVVETDLELYVPETYVENTTERIKLYRELDSIDDEEKLLKFTKTLEDRFGKIPNEIFGLFDILRLRWKAKQLGFEKLVLKQNKLICYFVADKNSIFYYSKIFAEILQYLQTSHNSSGLKENNEKLSLHFDKVNSLNKAKQIISNLYDSIFFVEANC
ncbi:MAG: transcription-repair coupling factor [Bacteroidetes bacterium GWA2_32_17]|nr:MAG: transcription-repair coupling factor [Bacteroidetes bacterium GWA2_32_17]